MKCFGLFFALIVLQINDLCNYNLNFINYSHASVYFTKMQNSHSKTGLVVLFNHNHEKNIPLIKHLYNERFSEMKILMPFYYGSDKDVIDVFGNSFVFHTYIAQAREKIMTMNCDDFLIIGDDLLLNPDLNELNFHQKLNIPHGAFYIDNVEDISTGDYYRPLIEATKFTTTPPGLDSSAARLLPSYENAFTILHDKGLMNSSILSKCTPFYQPWIKPFSANLYKNYKIFKGRVWHFLNYLKWKFRPKKASYPCVFGYSDIILIPRDRMEELCHYLEIMATWQMFVELAIPTSISLLKNAHVVYSNSIPYKTGNVWYPQNPNHFKNINEKINQLSDKCKGEINNLKEHFPNEYLYLHPVKLSQFNKK